MKKKGSIMLIIIMAIVGAYLIYNHFNKDENINNNNKNFNEEYSSKNYKFSCVLLYLTKNILKIISSIEIKLYKNIV